MERLPSEIIQSIAGQVDREDILPFRLTCRHFAAAGLERQFQVVPVSFFRKSFDNLIRISQHPVYRNCVLSIKYGPAVTREPKEGDVYEEQLLGNLEVEGPQQISGWDPEHDALINIAYWKDQEQMEADGYDFMSLQSAISRFPNLNEVQVQERDSGSETESENDESNQNPGTASHAPDSMDSFYNHRTLVDARQLTSILTGVVMANRPLSSLTCDSFDLEIFGGSPHVRISDFNDFVRKPETDLGFPLVCAAFKNLTYIDLITRSRSDTYSKPLQAQLGLALRGAQGLETLHIRSCLDQYKSPWHLHWEDIFGTSTWPRLKSLSVTRVKIKETTFIPFFTRHQPTLQDFTLDTAFAQEGDWAEILQSLKPPWSKLRTLNLAGAWGAANWIEILDQHDGRYVEVLNLSTPFGTWAQREAFAVNASQVLRRYIRNPDERLSPLRAEQDLRTSWARLKLAIGEQIDDILHLKGKLLLAEHVIGSRWRYRNAYFEYDGIGSLIR